jgi:hypothetical protein
MPDTTKYLFNGQKHGKGRLVLAVVREYVEQHQNAVFAEIRDIFPDKLQQERSSQFSSDGQCVVKRREEVNDSKRFHMKVEDQLVCNGEILVVSREWNVINIENFLTKARDLGFDIKKL